jgi:hypothetical protein
MLHWRGMQQQPEQARGRPWEVAVIVPIDHILHVGMMQG